MPKTELKTKRVTCKWQDFLTIQGEKNHSGLIVFLINLESSSLMLMWP